MDLAGVTAAAPFASFARGFACPQEGVNENGLRAIGVERSREVVGLFLDRHGKAISSGGSALAELLRGWAAEQMEFDVAWDPVFGILEDVLFRRSEIPPAAIAARLALRMQAGGCVGDWELALDRPVSARWANWMLPAASTLAVSSDGTEARVVASAPGDVRSLHFARTNGSWTSPDARACPEVRLLARRLTVLTGTAASLPELRFLADQLVDDERAPAACEALESAVVVLRDHAPEYLTWTERVMREVVPIRSVPGGINSGSSRNLPGMSHLSTEVVAPAIAEMLVHEATHNYYYLLTALGPVEDGSDEKLYYSPIKQRPRPIEYILLAYHAFANVLLMTRRLLASGCPDPDGYLIRNEAELVPQLRQLEAGLMETTGLTPLGVGLWRPLAERLV